MSQLTLATYNIWHGLSPASWVRFKSLEPVSRRKERELLQSQMLASLGLDGLFLQEVNPVANRAREFARKLQLKKYWSRDNAGMKFAGLGPPYNLDSGLVNLMKSEHIPEWTQSIRVSGESYSFVTQIGSVQWKESRYALMTSTVSPRVGRILWVNTHLHHGLEHSSVAKQAIAQKVEEGVISSDVALELTERVQAGDKRRDSEIKLLLSELNEIKSRYSLILLGGDFNCTPEARAWQALQNFGFQPLQTQAPGSLKTWNSEVNHSNHMLTREFADPVVVDDLSFNEKTKLELKKMLKDLVMAPKQIDYLWGWSGNGSIEITESKLFGEENDRQLAPSDHLGIVSTIRWNPSHV